MTAIHARRRCRVRSRTAQYYTLSGGLWQRRNITMTQSHNNNARTRGIVLNSRPIARGQIWTLRCSICAPIAHPFVTSTTTVYEHKIALIAVTLHVDNNALN